jgi:cell fate regulator YaaT (PSP1 superfamily)
MESSYLIRYGLWHQVGRFGSDSPDLERGQTVVVRSHRGTELGEVLIKNVPDLAGGAPSSAAAPGIATIVRVANPDDLEHARELERERPRQYDLCRRLIAETESPLELIDVEPLLEDGRIVLHYLGPHRLDVAGFLATLRSSFSIDVLLEPVGRDLPEEPGKPSDDDPVQGCGDCGSGGGGCGSGHGCGSGADSGSHGGCSDCGVQKLLSGRHALTKR